MMKKTKYMAKGTKYMAKGSKYMAKGGKVPLLGRGKKKKKTMKNNGC